MPIAAELESPTTQALFDVNAVHRRETECNEMWYIKANYMANIIYDFFFYINASKCIRYKYNIYFSI